MHSPTNSAKPSRFFPGVNKANIPARPSLRIALLAGIGGFLAITVLDTLARTQSIPLILGSFGASCMILFGLPDSPLAQPRNTIIGHSICTFIGLLFLNCFGDFWWAMPAAVSTAMILLMLTRTVHPPALSNPVIVFISKPGWMFLLTPTFAGAVVLVIVAYLYNNHVRKVHYPRYW